MAGVQGLGFDEQERMAHHRLMAWYIFWNGAIEHLEKYHSSRAQGCIHGAIAHWIDVIKPEKKKKIKMTIRPLENGVGSTWLHQLQSGQQL